MSPRIHILAMIGLCLGAAGCAPVPDGAAGPVYMADEMRRVVPLTSDGQFEVIGRAGDWGREYFCAAGDYARDRLGARPVDRVELVAPVGPAVTRPGTSAVFRLVPRAEGGDLDETGFILDMRRAGENRSVAHAQALCPREIKRLF